MSQMRRKDKEMDAEFALGVLRDCEYASLATVNPDGTPYCIPVSPVLSGNAVYFHCASEGKKLDNIRRDGNVCLCCVGRARLVPERFTTEYESAVAEGACAIVQDEGEKISALRLICEKYAADNMGAAERVIMGELSRTTVCRIELGSITGKSNYNKSEL